MASDAPFECDMRRNCRVTVERKLQTFLPKKEKILTWNFASLSANTLSIWPMRVSRWLRRGVWLLREVVSAERAVQHETY